MLFTYDKVNGLALSSIDGVTSLEHDISLKTSSNALSFHHVGGKDAQQTPSARGVSRWSARSGRHVVLCPELDAETNASPSPLLFLKQGAASGVHAHVRGLAYLRR